MQTFCPECGMNTETFMRAEIRECYTCCTTWECRNNPETTALRAKIERMIADNALHCKQYNAGVEAAKAGRIVGPRPEFDTSAWYDGYASVMLPVLRERITLLEGAAQADDQRLRAAADTAGIIYFGCDTPEVLADKVVELRERIAEFEAALAKWKECAKMLADELNDANSERFPVSWEDASESSPAWIIYANLKGGE